MNTTPDLARLQAALRGSGLDGWLIYDFRGLNPFPAQLLDLRGEMLTRRWFLFVPSAGAATLIHHRIEENAWLHLLPDPAIRRKLFSAHQELDAALQDTLAGAKRIAMEISPRGQVPYVSYVDAGTAERVQECGVEIVSSGDLLQSFFIWTEEDRQAHLRAVAGVIQAKDAGFRFIHERLLAQQTVTELATQEVIMAELTGAGLAFDHPAIVAFGSHASDGHYSPGPTSNRTLELGMCVLLDIWAGVPNRPMADITWVGFAGEPTTEYLHAWQAVADGRDLALHMLTTGAAREGWQVDRAARDLIAGRGYGEAFRHRLGHSLGRNHPHGPCANLDDLETHDTRALLPDLAVTVEPGVYPGPFGVRSEVNVLLTATGAIVTTPIQAEPYRVGMPAAAGRSPT
jgi:Xaa-Pro aminopeptidase